jgi:hypothetical protein
MKAFQIGDWLQHANGKYYQVTRIDRLGDGNIHFACGFPHLWEYNNKFEPIQLEKIHLAKNGFEAREETDDTEFYYYDCYEINVSFDEGLPEENIPPVIFLTIEFAEKSLCMPIEYVHELQQAMRIMGCDKEIEL